MNFTVSLDMALSPVSPGVAALIAWVFCAVVIAALCNRFIPWPKGCRNNPLLFSGIAILALTPMGNHPGLAAGLHGMMGAPSGTLMQLAILSFLNKPWPLLPARRTLFGLGLGMMVFYGLSMGMGQSLITDPYAWGFLPDDWVWLLLLLLAYGLFRHQQTGWLVILSINLLLWRSGLLASRNLWDAFFDPMLMVAVFWIAARQRSTTVPPTSPSEAA